MDNNSRAEGIAIILSLWHLTTSRFISDSLVASPDVTILLITYSHSFSILLIISLMSKSRRSVGETSSRYRIFKLRSVYYIRTQFKLCCISVCMVYVTTMNIIFSPILWFDITQQTDRKISLVTASSIIACSIRSVHCGIGRMLHQRVSS